MPDDVETDVQRVVQAVLAYLVHNPLAADSEQGIAQWWVQAASGVDMPMNVVALALQRLLNTGRLSRTVMADGRAIYRAAAPLAAAATAPQPAERTARAPRAAG